MRREGRNQILFNPVLFFLFFLQNEIFTDFAVKIRRFIQNLIGCRLIERKRSRYSYSAAGSFVRCQILLTAAPVRYST